ncbi:MAG TPA: sigma-70 family RNA polymerase sigma factor [Candidatus Dormibacteraeota bacterium]|nr:sigma-70 family RNA polymerase sigma factor [Candidatus Dormibacteraeota bacterium]
MTPEFIEQLDTTAYWGKDCSEDPSIKNPDLINQPGLTTEAVYAKPDTEDWPDYTKRRSSSAVIAVVPLSPKLFRADLKELFLKEAELGSDQPNQLANFESGRAREKALIQIVKTYTNHPAVQRTLAAYSDGSESCSPSRKDPNNFSKVINGYRLLNAADEHSLFSKIEEGLAVDQSQITGQPLTERQEQALIDLTVAHQIAFFSNLRLVVHYVQKRASYAGTLTFDDLIQEGSVGLATAVRRFEINRGHRFSTYATYWINNAVRKAIGEQSRTIKLPLYVHEQWVGLSIAQNRLAAMLGREVTTEELALANNMTAEQTQTLRRVGALVLPSLSNITDHQTEGSPNNLDSQIDNLSDKEELKKIFLTSRLNAREKAIISLRFGVYLDELAGVSLKTHWGELTYEAIFEQIPTTTKGLTLQEIGRIFGLSHQRIRQIEKKGLDKLRIVSA